MQKTELIGIVAEKCGIPKTKAKEVLNCVTATITDTVANGDNVVVQGFGTFKRVTRDKRTTNAFGKTTVVPRHYAMSFNVSSTVRAALSAQMESENKTKELKKSKKDKKAKKSKK